MEKKKFNSFGEHLRSLREAANLSLRVVAAELKMDASLLAKMERNERKANRQLIADVAAFFKVDEQELVNEYVSDVIAYKIVEENADLNLLRDIEDKVIYYRAKRDEEE